MESMANLGAQGVLEISEDVQISFDEGYILGRKDTLIKIDRLIKREYLILETYSKNPKMDDEFLRGVRVILDNITRKVNLVN